MSLFAIERAYVNMGNLTVRSKERIMSPCSCLRLLSVAVVLIFTSPSAFAENPPPPTITDLATENSQRIIRFTPYPAANEFKILRASEVESPYTEDIGGKFSGYKWISSLSSAGTLGFYRLRVSTLSEEALLTATLLNRLAFGPTPDELERVKVMGPQAYIEEQLAPEKIAEPPDVAAQLN